MLIIAFFQYATSLGQACIAGIEQEENGANLASLLFTMSLNFCGVLYYPTGFWSFMYRVSPFTYWVSSMLSSGVGAAAVECSPKEFVQFPPYGGQTCGEYMEKYISVAGGYLADPDATDSCSFCSMSSTNAFLEGVHIKYDNRWRDWGIFICYIAINYIITLAFYYIFRVPKNSNNMIKDESALKSKKLTNVDESPEDK
ncbi:unnamed protein product [Ambrosiozyma monospora]|uniref:Unnamed protein product n=1 Tax=Ambrosiozyma monospora TaxID=43982 RepID=A0ACB5TDK8_AMBMO|nr:unnamed protein product [Ambrosiozyma monospora]